MNIKTINELAEASKLTDKWSICADASGKTEKFPLADIINPIYRVIDNKLNASYDGGVTFEPVSDYIASYFRWSDNNIIQMSHDQKTWTDLSGSFTNNMFIKGYVDTPANLPSKSTETVGSIYMVGSQPPYDMYVLTSTGWTNNGAFQSLTAGVVNETGTSENLVMSQKAVTDKFTELESIQGFIKIYDKQYKDLSEALASIPKESRKEYASIYYKDEPGNFHFYYFLSANPSDTNWNNTSLWLPVYTGKEVDAMIAAAKSAVLTEVESTQGFVKLSDKQYKDLSEALSAIPNKLRTPYASIYYKGEDGKFHFYYFVSVTPSDANWNNTSLWLPIYTGQETDTKLNAISAVINVLKNYNGIVKLSDKQYASLEDAVAAVPSELRTPYASIYYKDEPGKFHFYYFLSASPSDANWNNTSLWLPIYTGFEVDAKLETLKSEMGATPKTIVEFYPEQSGGNGRFFVYMKQGNSNIYHMLELSHIIDNDEMVYLDIWRLNGDGGVFRYDGQTMTPLNVKLLLGVENEFTIRFENKSDYTGGYHGDERIDTDGSFAKFFIDGQLLTSAEMAKSFKKECESFYMLSSATLHDTSVDGINAIVGHPIVGRHIKRTIIDNCGFHCENRVDFDFSNVGESERQIADWFSGLVCVAKDCAIKSYAQDYVIRDTSKGDNEQISINNAIGGKVNMWGNKKLSCAIDSKVLTEDDKDCKILLWDRPTDTKYYRRPSLRKVKTGDVFMTEIDVRWEYAK